MTGRKGVLSVPPSKNCESLQSLRAALNLAVAECRARGFDGPLTDDWLQVSAEAECCQRCVDCSTRIRRGDEEH